MAQETVVLVTNVSDKYLTAEDAINNNFDELYAASGTAVWGSITGTLSDQTDLQAALDAKQSKQDYGNMFLLMGA